MKKILNRTFLKLLAITAMTCDHAALAFLSSDSVLYYLMRGFGRITAPIMAFFIAEGFMHTKSRIKYLSRLGAFALISQPFYFMLVFSRIPNNTFEFVTNLNVMFTFCSPLAILIIYENHKFPIWLKAVLIGICLAFSDICDWSYIIPAWTLAFRIFRNKPLQRDIVFIIISILLPLQKYLPQFDSFQEYSYFFAVLLAIIPISLYNGKKCAARHGGKYLSKWGFYIYYPLHIGLIILIKRAVG